MPGQVVDPALLPQLSHDGVNEGETGPSLVGTTGHQHVTASIYNAENEIMNNHLLAGSTWLQSRCFEAGLGAVLHIAASVALAQ